MFAVFLSCLGGGGALAIRFGRHDASRGGAIARHLPLVRCKQVPDRQSGAPPEKRQHQGRLPHPARGKHQNIDRAGAFESHPRRKRRQSELCRAMPGSA
jgi:hypothetical protein